MPSLTQTEAEERSRLLDVERYDVALDLTDLPTGPEVRCVSTVTFGCREPGASSFVDCAAVVAEATLNGKSLGAAEDGRIVLPGLAAHNTLVVSSVQAETTTGEGVHKAVDPADGEVYLWLSFEPDEGRHVWACFDQPDLKAPHAITVTAPAAWTVLSNSGDPAVTTAVTAAGSARTWAFPDTPRLATYNMVVNAGPFHEIRREAGGFDLGILARASLAAVLERDAEEILTVTAQGLEFFGRVFDMPFPQRKYDQVFMPEMGGAMENYGCVTWSDAFLRRSVPTAAENEYFALVILHEMAHMWFGNIVTMRWWDDLWLNEAFAEFAAHWAAVAATSYTEAWAGHLAGEKLSAYAADQGPTSHPIHQPITDVDQAASIFDAITYPKGAATLHQLMVYVGEPEFTAGMAAYFAEHAWGTTVLQDLIDALSASSGRDLGAWRDGWLGTAGTDRFTLETDDRGFVLVGTGPSGPPRPHRMAVGSYRRGAGGLERTALAEIEVAGPRTAVELPTGADLYLVNDEDLTFTTTRPDAATRDALFADAAWLPTPIARAVAVATAWDMLHNGEATAGEVVRALAAVVVTETADTVVEPYLRLAREAAQLWSPDGERAALDHRLATACRTLLEQPGRRQVAQRYLAATSEDLDELGELLAGHPDVPDVDLGWRVLVRLAELGHDTTSEVSRLRVADPDPDVWLRALAVQAAAPDAAAKAAVWQHLAVDNDVPVGSLRGVTTAFWRPGQDAALAPYAASYLELLPHLHRGGMIPAMSRTRSMFPVFAIDPGFADQALEAARQAAPVVAKTVAESVDEVRRMLASRKVAPLEA